MKAPHSSILNSNVPLQRNSVRKRSVDLESKELLPLQLDRQQQRPLPHLPAHEVEGPGHLGGAVVHLLVARVVLVRVGLDPLVRD